MIQKKPYILKKDAYVGDIIRDCPRAMQLLAEYGLLCVNCPLNQFDTLEKGAQIHQMTREKIEKMIKEINKQLKKET